MHAKLFPTISSDLTVAIADRSVQLTPSQGIRIAERLARASFRQLLAEEAQRFEARPAGRSTGQRRTKR